MLRVSGQLYDVSDDAGGQKQDIAGRQEHDDAGGMFDVWYNALQKMYRKATERGRAASGVQSTWQTQEGRRNQETKSYTKIYGDHIK